MKGKIILILAVVSLLVFQACQKTERNDSNENSLSGNLDVAVAEVITTQATQTSSTDIQSVSVEKFDGSSAAFRLDGLNFGHGTFSHVKFGIPHIDSCATVTVSSSTYPKEIVIDYGTGCSFHMRHAVQGKIIINISDSIKNAGATETITYQDFYVDSMKIELTASLKNLGQNESGHWIIEKKVQQKITKNEETCSKNLNEVVEWISGFETIEKSDDVFYESGSGTITINDTATYSKTITKPLLIDRSCDFIVSGTEELNRNGNIVIIDYGDGTCDNIATVTTNGTTEEIELHQAKFNEGGKFGKHCHHFGDKREGKGRG
jgi:hypothetical protein